MPPGLATCFGNSGLAAVTSISWGQNPNMGAIGDQWVRKWGWFISFLRGRGCWRCRHFLTVNVNFVQFFIVCCFSPKNWTPEFKVKFCLQSGKWKQRVSYGLLIWVWRPDSFFGLQDVLCRVWEWFVCLEMCAFNEGAVQIVYGASGESAWERPLGLAETSWASETSSSSSLDKGHPSRPLHHCPPLHLPWV